MNYFTTIITQASYGPQPLKIHLNIYRYHFKYLFRSDKVGLKIPHGIQSLEMNTFLKL